jgi:hypothetical protein
LYTSEEIFTGALEKKKKKIGRKLISNKGKIEKRAMEKRT